MLPPIAIFGFLGGLHDHQVNGEHPLSALPALPAVQGMRKEEPEVDVRHAATVALQNALTFAHNNFSNDSERNYIMQIICEGTLAGEVLVEGCCTLRGGCALKETS